MWCLLDNATPLNCPSTKNWVSDLSSEVFIVFLPARVLSEYWKRLEENFQNVIISAMTKFTKKSSSLFQYSKRTIASTETNNSSKERPDTQHFGTRNFKGVALSGGCHVYLLQKAYYFVAFLHGRGVFWLFTISRRLLLDYNHFQGVILKLSIRAFFWSISCFSTSIGSFQISGFAFYTLYYIHLISSIVGMWICRNSLGKDEFWRKESTAVI